MWLLSLDQPSACWRWSYDILVSIMQTRAAVGGGGEGGGGYTPLLISEDTVGSVSWSWLVASMWTGLFTTYICKRLIAWNMVWSGFLMKYPAPVRVRGCWKPFVTDAWVFVLKPKSGMVCVCGGGDYHRTSEWGIVFGFNNYYRTPADLCVARGDQTGLGIKIRLRSVAPSIPRFGYSSCWRACTHWLEAELWLAGFLNKASRRVPEVQGHRLKTSTGGCPPRPLP